MKRLTPLCAVVVLAVVGDAQLGASIASAAAGARPPSYCAPQVRTRACAGPVAIGVGYRYRLQTHCGIRAAYFDGRLWRARPPLDDGSGNPPRGWGNPEQIGVMRLVRNNLTVFRAAPRLVAHFTPAPRSWKLRGCA